MCNPHLTKERQMEPDWDDFIDYEDYDDSDLRNFCTCGHDYRSDKHHPANCCE